MLKAMTEAKGVLYLDYFAEMTDDRNGLPSELTTDEVHVTKAGYEIMEKMVEEVSFTASDRSGETITIDEAYVAKHVGELAKNADLSKFIL